MGLGVGPPGRAARLARAEAAAVALLADLAAIPDDVDARTEPPPPSVSAGGAVSTAHPVFGGLSPAARAELNQRFAARMMGVTRPERREAFTPEAAPTVDTFEAIFRPVTGPSLPVLFLLIEPDPRPIVVTKHLGDVLFPTFGLLPHEVVPDSDDDEGHAPGVVPPRPGTGYRD